MNEFGCRPFKDRIGIVLAQLGTPDAPTAPALRRYLKQFLWDKRVIEVNRALWWCILNLIILQVRPRRSARLYKRIWEPEGSPLLLITERQSKALQDRLTQLSVSAHVELGMRYGNPPLEEALDKLCDAGCTKILLIPMYPQYAAPTTASTYDAVFPHLLKRRYVPTLQVLDPFFAHSLYIEALAHSINASLATCERAPEKLILSYHGMPQSYILKGDPYCCQCRETTRALVPHLKFPAENVIHCFQSRFGREPWLQPYTDYTIKALAEQGVRRIALAAPSFIADCLETIDELGTEGKNLFVEHGGESVHLIPCLNDGAVWIDAFAKIVQQAILPWQTKNEVSPGCICSWRSGDQKICNHHS
jgi:protoporphyrin/coproporphyrin ferrochelatase